MYNNIIMNITLSMSSRGLVYFPDALQKRLKLKKPGKITIKLIDDNNILIKPVKDIFSMVGKLKSPTGKKFDLEKFRSEREQNYERL